jgi:hypothetical protein
MGEFMSEKLVLTVGLGKAGTELHLPNWTNAGFEVEGYDPSEAKRDSVKAGDKDITVVDSFTEDITAGSGHHLDALESVSDAIKAGLEAPKVWLIEKPIYSLKEERFRLEALMQPGGILANPEQVFVNENYNVSYAVEKAQELIEKEKTFGNPVIKVDVVFYKNRIPDVLAGRFVDPGLETFGIEMPHEIAVAYSLAGVAPNEDTTIIESWINKAVHGVEHSEATYVQVKSADGVLIRMAQGLGTFTMDAAGEMVDNEKPEIVRYADVTLADGRTIHIDFDPVAGIDRFNSQVVWIDKNSEIQTEVMPDNTIKRVFGLVALNAETGERPRIADGLSLPNAIKLVDELHNFLDYANKSADSAK